MLSICTGFIFALICFWYLEIRIQIFYKKVERKDATHVKVIKYATNDLPKNVEVCELYSSELENPVKKDTFKYRFI